MSDFNEERRRLKEASRPSAGTVRAYQKAFYSDHTGITEDVLSRTAGGSGFESYRRLLDLVPAPCGKTILDLGCGAGVLTGFCAGIVGPEGHVIGSDFSSDQIDLARRRLELPNVVFRCEDAAGLDMDDGEADAVLSHLALMLMTPIEPVVSELARVLKPGGLLAAVVAAIGHTRPLYQEFSDILDRVLRDETPRFKRLGDDRTYSVEGLRSLFNPISGFEEEWRKIDYHVCFEDVPDRLTPLIVRFFNSYHLLSREGADTVRREATEVFRNHRNGEGRVRFEVPLTLVVFTRGG